MTDNDVHTASSSVGSFETEISRATSAAEKKLSAIAKQIADQSTCLPTTTSTTGTSDDPTTDDDNGNHAGTSASTSCKDTSEPHPAHQNDESGYRFIWIDNLIDTVNKLHRF